QARPPRGLPRRARGVELPLAERPRQRRRPSRGPLGPRLQGAREPRGLRPACARAPRRRPAPAGAPRRAAARDAHAEPALRRPAAEGDHAPGLRDRHARSQRRQRRPRGRRGGCAPALPCGRADRAVRLRARGARPRLRGLLRPRRPGRLRRQGPGLLRPQRAPASPRLHLEGRAGRDVPPPRMVFSSQIFLFWFLPVALAGYYALLPGPRWSRHLFLIAVSYVFYGWAHPPFALLLLLTTARDYGLAPLRTRRACP